MKVAVTGSSGLVGSALCESLKRDGCQIVRLSRAAKLGREEIRWDPVSGEVDLAGLEGCDSIVHLAGENIAKGRWTAEKKKRLTTSRVDATRSLVRAIGKLSSKPKSFIAASAIGYYGNRGDEVMTEDSKPGSSFLADLCKNWESESLKAADLGVRVACIRIGVVLSKKGGALAAMLTPFKMGGGGVLGPGTQYFSTISLPDLVGVIRLAIEDERLKGAVNAVQPESVTNRSFTKTLGKVISRPTIFPMPQFAARLVFGEMADELLLASTRVEPKRLKEIGFQFQHPSVESALRAALE
jgi:hypothetical protein